jgi:ADP-heptose:LPS heptosyltransferase
LILHFGSLVEVTLSLPALSALRQHFSHSHITVAATPMGCQLIGMTPYANDVSPVSEIDPKEAVKPWVIYRWVRFLQDVRRGGYDFTIDFQSRGLTNVLTWLSRAPVRLAARRRGSLDFLFNLWPPKEDPRKHLVDRYFDLLRPLGLQPANRTPRLRTLPDVDQRIEKRLKSKEYQQGQLLVGIYPGAGREVGHWFPELFVDLGRRLIHNLDVRLLVLSGSENSQLAEDISDQLPPQTIFLDDLSIAELVSALTHCTALISDDAGAGNLAAAVSTPVLGLGFPSSMAPIGQEHVVISWGSAAHISVDEVFTAASQLVKRSRTTALFQE